MDRITQAVEEPPKGTGNICIPAQADVRNPNEPKEAVRKTVGKFGRIDLAICDQSKLAYPSFSGQLKIDFGHLPIGAGTSLLSKNAFRTVVEVGSYSVISLGTMRYNAL